MQYDAMIQVLVVPTGRGAMGPIGPEAASWLSSFYNQPPFLANKNY